MPIFVSGEARGGGKIQDSLQGYGTEETGHGKQLQGTFLNHAGNEQLWWWVGVAHSVRCLGR